MSVPNQLAGANALKNEGLSLIQGWLRRGDILMATGIMGILVVLIFPLPAMLLDMLLAVSIIFSVLILMTALFIQKPLEFSTFPTILLIATMLRLALNLASTRLILGHGHEGPQAAGGVIHAFGNLVMGGNFVIGLIVFAILVLVNFVVITKGSGRIAEVAARFSLDAMPGKQMAIDADLNAGLIDETVAKARRKELEDESSFYGSMDGASKFVRGDAIAGLIITFINLVGGIIVGVAQMGVTFSEAAHSYTVLTVGDGLVTQIPALIVSIAAGLLVTKAGVSGSADKALISQLSFYPNAMGMSAVVMAILATLPGMPTIPFLGLAMGAAWATKVLNEQQKLAAAKKAESASQAETASKKKDEEEPASSALKIDDLRIEIGYALMPLIEGGEGNDRLSEQIKALRRSLAMEMGFLMPAIRIVDNVQLEPNTYVIKIKEVDAGQGKLYPGQYMTMNPGGGPVELPGVHVLEPTFNLPATWVEGRLREEASFKGYTVVDAPTVLSTHLTEVLKSNVGDLLSYAEVQKLIKELPSEQQELVKDIVPTQITYTGIQRVLQHLLAERVSIRDLSTILEGIAEAAGPGRNPQMIAEHVRSRLARQISASYLNGNNQLPLIALSPTWEQIFLDAIVGQGDERQLALAPSKLTEFVQLIRDRFEDAARQGEIPVLLTSATVRPFVRTIVERFRSATPVLSQNEIPPRVKLKTVGSI